MTETKNPSNMSIKMFYSYNKNKMRYEGNNEKMNNASQLEVMIISAYQLELMNGKIQ